MTCDLEDWEEKAHGLNDEGVCRTAPTTQGLLKTTHTNADSRTDTILERLCDLSRKKKKKPSYSKWSCW